VDQRGINLRKDVWRPFRWNLEHGRDRIWEELSPSYGQHLPPIPGSEQMKCLRLVVFRELEHAFGIGSHAYTEALFWRLSTTKEKARKGRR